MAVTKAVLVAAGYGSRFLPITRSIPKEMLPLVDRPALDFVVQEFVEAGITDLLVITSRRKKALDDWFDRAPELEQAFAEAPHKLKGIVPPQLCVQFVRQQRMQGTGHALLLAESFAAGDPVVVAFPDDLFNPAGDNVTAALAEVHQRTGCSVLACAELPPGADVSRYGVVRFADSTRRRVAEVVEKPAPGTEPSRVISLGRYLYTAEIYELLRQGMAQHERGEFYPMDAIRQLAARGLVAAALPQAQRWDTGQPLGYLQAVVEAALSREDVGPAFRTWLQDRLQS